MDALCSGEAVDISIVWQKSQMESLYEGSKQKHSLAHNGSVQISVSGYCWSFQ